MAPSTRRAFWYAVTAVPFVVAGARALATDWYPIGDAAQLYIRATDVLTAHHPWLGSASSASTSIGFQLSNAGPLYFDLMAPFAHTFPPGSGAVLGVIAINTASLALAGLAAHRIGGAGYERWVLGAGAVLAWTLGSELLFDMFQAHALLFPFLAASVLLSGLALGQWWVLPWLAFVATLILQTHVSYAFILPMLVIAAAGLAARASRHASADSTAALTRHSLIAGGVVLVTWAQPIGEQLFGSGQGNLARLARAAGSDEITLGSVNAIKLTAAFVALPPWAGRQGFRSTIEPSGIEQTADGRQVVVLAGMPPGWLAALALVATVVLLGLAWWWARRHAIAVLAALAALAAVGVVGSVVAFSRLTVTPLGFAPHHSRWIVVIALLVYVTLAWAGWAALTTWWAAHSTRRPGIARFLLADRQAGVAALAVLLVASLANLPKYAQPHGPTADADALPALQAAFDQIDVAIDDGTLPGPVFFDLTNERVYAPHTSALQLYFRERGVEFRVDGEFMVRHLGERRRADGTEPSTLIQYHDAEAESVAAFLTAPRREPATGAPPDECLIAYVPASRGGDGWPAMAYAVTRAGGCPESDP